MTARTFDLLHDAIRRRKPVILFYAGHARAVCPHVLGTKDGQAHVLVFQFAGGSSRPLPTAGAWKCLAVGGIREIAFHDGPWHSAQNYDPHQSCVNDVIAAVALGP